MIGYKETQDPYVLRWGPEFRNGLNMMLNMRMRPSSPCRHLNKD